MDCSFKTPKMSEGGVEGGGSGRGVCVCGGGGGGGGGRCGHLLFGK